MTADKRFWLIALVALPALAFDWRAGIASMAGLAVWEFFFTTRPDGGSHQSTE